jgi:MinD superfamily P-loop ATPase
MQAKPKQLTVVSGKGGTGKTTCLASFVALAQDKVLADCDVDAANLYLLTHPETTDQGEFYGAKIAVRDEEECVKCGACEQACRFDAITIDEVDVLACEGCGLCTFVCPQDALRLEAVVCGRWYTGETKYGPMAHARLLPAAESSGRLVTLVRQKAEDLAFHHELPLILIDGPPGLGCTTTAALADVDMALVVTEPTLSGMHDMARQVDMIGHFGIPAAAIINKWDINAENTQALREYCEREQLPVLAEIPYDTTVTDALADETPLVEHNDGPASQAIRGAWDQVAQMLTAL